MILSVREKKFSVEEEKCVLTSAKAVSFGQLTR